MLSTRGAVRSGSRAGKQPVGKVGEREPLGPAEGIQLHHRRVKPHQSPDIGSLNRTKG